MILTHEWKDIQKIAIQVANSLEYFKKEDGTGTYKLKESSPDWMRSLMGEAVHDNHQWLPDDYRYKFAMWATDSIASFNSIDEILQEIVPDGYIKDLLDWLASNNYRIEYCNEVLNQGLVDMNSEDAFITIIEMAQITEKEEVLFKIIKWIEVYLDGQNCSS